MPTRMTGKRDVRGAKNKKTGREKQQRPVQGGSSGSKRSGGTSKRLGSSH